MYLETITGVNDEESAGLVKVLFVHEALRHRESDVAPSYHSATSS